MKARCLNRNNPYFHKYGGAGVSVCDEWLDFANFLRDMGDRPSREFTLDRIANAKVYSKATCRWATREEQQNNRDCVKKYRVGDREGSAAQWARWLGVQSSTVYYHLKMGKTMEQIVASRKAATHIAT